MVVVRHFILPQPAVSSTGRSPSVLCVSARVIIRLRGASGFKRRVPHSVQFVFRFKSHSLSSGASAMRIYVNKRNSDRPWRCERLLLLLKCFITEDEGNGIDGT